MHFVFRTWLAVVSAIVDDLVVTEWVTLKVPSLRIRNAGGGDL